MDKLKLSLFATFFFCFFFTVSAQELEVLKIEGKKCYIHTVEAGHTLYAITKKYNISYDNLIKANPGIDETLTIGRKLVIPLDCIDKKELNKKNVSLDGDNIIHVISKGETLYSISKKYEISIDELLDLNPSISANNIAVRQEIIIPVKELSVDENVKLASNGSYFSHIVKKGETLYSISKLYEVSIDSIMMSNLEAINKNSKDSIFSISNLNSADFPLSIGQILKIPHSTQVLNDSIDTLLFDSLDILDTTLVFKSKYDIALMLPFNFDKNESKLNNPKNKKAILYGSTLQTIKFYLGFVDGLEYLKDLGFRYNLTILDTKNDTNQIKNIVLNNDLDSFDLVFGPIVESNFNYFSNLLDSNNVKTTIVSPFNFSNSFLLNHPHLAKLKSSEITEAYFLASYIVDSLKNKNVILLNPGTADDQNLSDVLLKNIKELSLDDSVEY